MPTPDANQPIQRRRAWRGPAIRSLVCFLFTWLPLAAPAQIGGAGWSAYPVSFKVQSPYTLPEADRYWFTNGIYHCQVFSNDAPFAAGNTTLPRTEQRFEPDYTSGEIQYQATLMAPGTENSYCMFQIHTGDAESPAYGSTTFMVFWFTADGGSVHDYSGAELAGNLANQWYQLNVDHNLVTHGILVWVNQNLVWSQRDNGANDFYFKDGVYEQGHGPTLQMDTFISNNIEMWAASGFGIPLRWGGTTNGVWDATNTANWSGPKGGALVEFTNYNCNSVLFDDTAGVNTKVVLNETVFPVAVTNNSSTNNFTISGPGAIGGGASLVKSGTSTLTLSNVETFTGATTINGGTLALAAGNLSASTLADSSGLTINRGGTVQVITDNSLAGSGAGIGSLPVTINAGGTLTGLGTADAGAGTSTHLRGLLTLNGGTLTDGGTQIQTKYGTWDLDDGVAVNSGTNSSTTSTISCLDVIPSESGGTIFNVNASSPATPSGIDLLVSGSLIIGTSLADTGLILTGNGVMELTGVNTFIGSISNNGVTLIIGGAGQLGGGSYTGDIGNSGIFTYNSSATQTLAGIISGNGALNQNGPGTLTLTGANTCGGKTTISGGVLALGGTGSINGTPGINIAAGATLDVSAQGAYTLGSGTTLIASGVGAAAGTTAATIKGAAGGTVSLGSQPISLTFTPISFNGDTSHPSLCLSQGTLLLNGNPITVNNAASTPLGAGHYRLIQQYTGSVSISGPLSLSLTGSGVAAGDTYSLQVSGDSVNLVVLATPAFANLPASQSVVYGTMAITLSGAVGAPGPVFPAGGETVDITIDGNTQPATIGCSNGAFGLSYNPTTIPANATPYPISYSYPGNASLNPATNAASTLTINPLPVILTGTRAYDGTTRAAAAVLSVANVVGSDNVVVAAGSATLAGTAVGAESITSVVQLALGGASAGNYSLTGASGTVTITNSFSPFAIVSSSLDTTGTPLVICWQSVPGVVYRVLASPSLLAPQPWATAGGPITATNVTTCFAWPGGMIGNTNVFVVIQEP